MIAELAEQLQCLVRESGEVWKRRKWRLNCRINKIMVLEREGIEVDMNKENIEGVSLLKYLRSSFSRYRIRKLM